VGHTGQQILYLPHRDIIQPTHAAATPQMARPRAQTPASAEANPADTPHLIHDTPHVSCAPDVHADLHAVITAWPTLSAERRAAILQLIQGEEVRG